MSRVGRGEPEDAAAHDDDVTDRREFLKRFASLSAATVLLGAATACCPVVVYGPNPDEERPEETGPEPEPQAVYGPPPAGSDDTTE